MRKKILGIPTLLFVLGIVLFGSTASAILVSYLSNTAVTAVSVESPLLVRVAPETGGTWETSQDLGTVYGGDTVKWRTRVDNRADAVISGSLVATIDNGVGSASCGDFTALYFFDPTPATWIDALPMCADVGGQAVVTIPVVYTALEVESYASNMTFNPAVMPANYTVSSQVMV